VLLKTFIDDSADERQEKVVIAGAFIGRMGQWSEIKTKWRRRLRREGIEYFRSTEYNSLSGQFFKFRDPVKYPKPAGSKAAKQLRNDLEEIVRKSKTVGVAVCIPMPLFNSFRERNSTTAQIFTEPFQLALQLLFKELSNAVKAEIGDGHCLTFVVDDSSSAQRIEKVYLEFKRINPELALNMEGLTHLNDKTCPPLQVADMMASIAKEVYSEWPGGPLQVVPKRLEESIRRIWIPDSDYFDAILTVEKHRRGLP
jgi:hypothetical protein